MSNIIIFRVVSTNSVIAGEYPGISVVKITVIITSVVFILLLRDKIHYLSDNFHTKIHNNKKIINNESGW